MADVRINAPLPNTPNSPIPSPINVKVSWDLTDAEKRDSKPGPAPFNPAILCTHFILLTIDGQEAGRHPFDAPSGDAPIHDFCGIALTPGSHRLVATLNTAANAPLDDDALMIYIG